MPRDTLQPFLDALDVELQTATNASRNCRFTVQFVDDLIGAVAGVLDDLEQAQAPHDERLQEARQLLRATAQSLLGPGNRDQALDTLPDVARAIREAAGVAMNADINVLLQEIADASRVFSRPEYGPKSRWQNLRDEIAALQTQLAAAQELADTAAKTADQLNGDLDAERIRTTSLQESLDRATTYSTRDGLRIIQLRDVLNTAAWNTDLQVWTLTDDQRKAALDV